MGALNQAIKVAILQAWTNAGARSLWVDGTLSPDPEKLADAAARHVLDHFDVSLPGPHAPAPMFQDEGTLGLIYSLTNHYGAAAVSLRFHPQAESVLDRWSFEWTVFPEVGVGRRWVAFGPTPSDAFANAVKGEGKEQ